MSVRVNFHVRDHPVPSPSVPIQPSPPEARPSCCKVPKWDDDVSLKWWVIGWVVAGLLALFLGIFIPASFTVVHYHERAFLASRYGTVDLSRVLEPGRHTKWEWERPIPIDATYEPVQFKVANGNPLVVFLDGVDIRIDAVLQYRPDPARLSELYAKYNTGYLSQIVSRIQPVLKSVTSNLKQTDYVMNRNVTERLIGEAVEQMLLREMFIIAPAEKFKLLRVYFPQNVVNNNIAAALATQGNELATFNQQLLVARGETSRQLALIQAQERQTVSLANITATTTITTTENLARSILTSARARAQTNLFQQLGVQNSTMQARLVLYFDVLDSAGSLKVMSSASASGGGAMPVPFVTM